MFLNFIVEKKGQITMATMTVEDALHLYNILDRSVGVFRQEEMPEGAVKFHEKKKEDFLNLFSTDVPESYWFQGVKIHSITLRLDGAKGFHIVPELEPEGYLKPLIETTNRKIREANLVVKA